MYSTQFYREFFSAIPAEKWVCRSYRVSKLDAKGLPQQYCCALGHCGESANASTPMGLALRKMFEAKGLSVPKINDGDYRFSFEKGDPRNFPQKTPRERILAALDWLDAQGE